MGRDWFFESLGFVVVKNLLKRECLWSEKTYITYYNNDNKRTRE